MATKRNSSAGTAKKGQRARSGAGSSARSGARSGDMRKRIRDLTVRALRDRNLTPGDVSAAVKEALEDAADVVDRAMPASRSSVLRQVTDGLGDALHAVAQAGAQTIHRARQGGRDLTEHTAPLTAKHLRAANEELLRAVGTFAKRTSVEMAEELRSFVTRARRTGGRVRASAQQAARAADGHLMELTEEAARAGMSAARNAASRIALAASGMFEGIGEAMMPRKPAAAGSASRRGSSKKRAKPKRGAKRAASGGE